MNGLILAALLIIIPIIGIILNLMLSRLDDSLSAQGKTRDWFLFLLIFLPSAILSFSLLGNIHDHSSYSVNWLPGISIGLRLSEETIVFAAVIANLSALLALYTISYMTFDHNRTRYWFFYLLTMSAMMLTIFANNLYWLFGGMVVASISAFFLISHWHTKSGEEGEKAGKGAIRYLIMNLIGDILILAAFSFLLAAYHTPNINELFICWTKAPINFIGGSSNTTRILVKTFLVFGALIKSAQFPLLFWPLSGDKRGSDVSKTPISASMYLISVTIGNIGLFLLCILYPLFSTKGFESGTSVILFSNKPFILVGWFAILTLIVVIGFLISTRSITRLTIGLGVIQLSFSFLAWSAGNELGYASAIFHIITAAPATIALSLIFASTIESLRINDISRISGLKKPFPQLYTFGIILLFSYFGMFPGGVYFSKEMIFKSLLSSTIPSSKAILALGIICSLLIIPIIVKNFMKIFNGQINVNYSIRPISPISIISIALVFGWSLFSGLLGILIGYPHPYLLRGLLNKALVLPFDTPILSSWFISPINIILLVSIFVITFYLYRNGANTIAYKIDESKVAKAVTTFFSNGLYLDKTYDFLVFQPISFLSKFVSWIRLKSPFASIFLAIISVVLLVAILFLVGGGFT